MTKGVRGHGEAVGAEAGGRREEGREHRQKASWRRWDPELHFRALAGGAEGTGNGLQEASVRARVGGGGSGKQ